MKLAQKGRSASGYRRMASAVIVLAIQDYTGRRLTYTGLKEKRTVTSEHRKTAERFLMSPHFDFWCLLAGTETAAVRERVIRADSLVSYQD